MEFTGKLDRTSFRIQTHVEEERNKVFTAATAEERLAVATYLIKSAYGFLEHGFPPMDKTHFEIKRRQ